jgi:hypothetical protein
MSIKMFIVLACGLQFFNTIVTLAYLCTEFIMSVKMFIVPACSLQSPNNNTDLTNTSLLQYGINYGRKEFSIVGP